LIAQRCRGPALSLALVVAAAGCGSGASSTLVTPDGGGGARGGASGSNGGSSGGTGGGGGVGGGAGAGATSVAGANGGGGAAGSIGPGGSAAGAAGTAGGGGAAGTSGAGGAAGTTGTGGTSGVGGAGGTAGTSGMGGAGGAAGTSGAGGVAGSRGGSTAGSGGGGTAGTSVGGRGGTGGGAGTGETTLDPTPGSYRQICDGSFGVMIDATHFLDGDDEEQGMRLYTRGATGDPLTTIDVSSGIGLSSGDEADFEDAARIGNRVFVISSHGRTKSGVIESARYHFFAMDVAGTSPNVTLTVPGYTTMLLEQMLVAANWTTPNTAVLATLAAASNLGTATDANLAPMANGTNIEGLAWAPTTARPNQLLIGFRNPPQGGAAIVVSLLNAAEVLTGATARFGEATLLDLGGLGIRAMAWSPLHTAVLLIAGPRTDAAGPFRLFKWSGAAADLPVAVQDITGVPSASAPEAIVVYPNTRDVQILFDQGDHDIGGDACKDADESDRWFGDTIIQVP